MNITISQITNGWIVAVASPKGQSAIYCSSYEDVLNQLAQLKEPPQNVTPLRGN